MPLSDAQKFRLRLTKNQEARALAHSTIHQTVTGWWLVVIGGLQQGTVHSCVSFQNARDLVNSYYNAQMMTFTRNQLIKKGITV